MPEKTSRIINLLFTSRHNTRGISRDSVVFNRVIGVAGVRFVSFPFSNF